MFGSFVKLSRKNVKKSIKSHNQRFVRIDRADASVTWWRIDDSVLANTPTPKEIISVSLLYGTSTVKILKSLV